MISRLISGLTFPLLMPTYAILLSFCTTFLWYLPSRPLVTTTLVIFGITAMVPIIAIYFLHAAGIISDPMLNNRRDRTIPYAITTACYLGAAAYLHAIHAPIWMTAYAIGAAVLVIIIMCINLRWKISGHAAGMGGLTALAAYVTYRGYCIVPSMWLPAVMVILSGIVCTARLLLGRHTLTQVAAGYALAFAGIYISMFLSH